MPKVGFNPNTHSFHFSNNFVNKVASIPGHGNVETEGRCGGMAYAALDYYHAGVPIPAYPSGVFSAAGVPPDGHWLADYIYERLMNSFTTGSAVKFIEWTAHADHETWFFKGVTRWTKEDEFSKLRQRIDAGTPVVLGLISTTNVISDHHQVVAYGYDFDPGSKLITVYLYDNNTPRQEVRLESAAGNPHFSASNGNTWRGFFVQDYQFRQPPVFTRFPASSASAVRYGDTIKLGHLWTGRTLHSHALNYGHSGSSGQQQVTGFYGADDNDLWLVKGPHGQPESYKLGYAVQTGDIIRLEHVLTRRNLHSHANHPSPVTRQQEVTAFGEHGIGDSNDNWRVELDPSGGSTWHAPDRTRLIHVNTSHALHSHSGFSHGTYTAGQQEITGFGGRDDNDWWLPLEIRSPAPSSLSYAERPFVAAHSGRALDVAGASPDNGAELIQWDYHGGGNQRFRIEPVGSGYYRLVCVHSGRVLDIAWASHDNGAQVIQWDWNGGDNQLFRIEALGDGTYRIVARHSGRVLDVAGAAHENGARLIQCDWHGGANQRWRL